MRRHSSGSVLVTSFCLAALVAAPPILRASDGATPAGSSPAVSVEVVAGSGSNGDGGLADQASFVGVAGLAADPKGNIYLSDSGANRVRRIDVATGMIATVAGSGRLDNEGTVEEAAGRIRAPGPLAVGPDERSLYVGEVVGKRVKRIDLDTGAVEDLGAPAGGWARISGLAWSRVGLIVCDALLGRVYLRTPNGTWTGLLAANFRLREGIRTMVQDFRGRIYIAEYFSHRVLRLDPGNGSLEVFAGIGEAGMGADGMISTQTALRGPDGLVFDRDGRLLIGDSGNRRILAVDITTGKVSTVRRAEVDSRTGLWTPGALAMDRDGNLWVADSESDRLLRFSPNAAEPQIFGEGGIGDRGLAASARLAHPSSVAVDSRGNIYISDTLHHRIRKVNAEDGTIDTVAGTGIPGYNGDGIVATEAWLSYPAQIQIDRRDRLFVADYYNNRIRVMELPGGRIFTYAGTGQAGEDGDGLQAIAATMANPHVLLLDGPDSLIVASAVVASVRRIDLNTGQIRTISVDGMPSTEIIHGLASAKDGLLLVVPRPLPGRIDLLKDGKRTTVLRGPELAFPYHAVTTPTGEIYICDTGHNRILKWNGTTLSQVVDNIGRPRAIALDRDGNLLVADTFHNQVLRLRLAANPH